MRPRSWGDRYELTLIVGLLAMLLFAVGNSMVPDMLEQVQQRGHSRARFSLALFSLVLALWVRAWYFAGPLAVSVGRFQWLMWRQEPRGSLRREAVTTYLVGGTLATVPAALSALAAPTGGGYSLIAALVVWSVLQLFLVLTMQLQRRDLDGVARSLPFALGSLGVALAVGEAWNGTAAALGGACLLTGLVLARRRTWTSAGARNQLTPRWQLHRGARGRWSLGAGVTMLDHEVVRVVQQREAKATQQPLPTFVYRLRQPFGLAVATLLRSLRTVLPTISLVGPLIFALHRLLGPLPALLLTALLELFVTVAMARSFEWWLRSHALSRTWATAGSHVPMAVALLGVSVSLVMAATVSLALGFPPLAALTLLVLPVSIVARRRSTHSGPGENALLATPFGAVPLHTVNRVVAGPDMVLLSVWMANWVM